MLRSLRRSLVAFSCILAIGCATAEAQQAPASALPQSAGINPYAPYEFLIGEWDTTGSGVGPTVAVQRFRWGPGRSYILYSTATVDAEGHEHLHFEGIIVFNAATRDMDFLIALEPGSLSQEHGTLQIETDGLIVRNVTLVAADGSVSHFRQSFRASGSNSAATALMRLTAAGGWEPSFPGSDNLVMTRRQG